MDNQILMERIASLESRQTIREFVISGVSFVFGLIMGHYIGRGEKHSIIREVVQELRNSGH